MTAVFFEKGGKGMAEFTFIKLIVLTVYGLTISIISF